jgi:hypothetical protein
MFGLGSALIQDPDERAVLINSRYPSRSPVVCGRARAVIVVRIPA